MGCEKEVHILQCAIFGVAPLFLSPVKKMLRMFAMLYEFFVRDLFFLKRLQKVVPSLNGERLTNFDPKK
jgi:hypothetical protein